MSEERRARQSAVIARVFLDRDGDGRYGPGDTTVPGARIEVDGRRRGETTDDRGLVRVPLIPYRHNDLGIAEGTLEDPFWVAAEEGRGFVGRPGVEWSADFPVLVTGEIEGTVYLERGGERSEVANVLLELVEAGGEVVATSKSQFDGFYLFERIRPGVYTVRAALEQSARLGFEIEPRKVALAGGEIEIGIDLVATEPEE